MRKDIPTRFTITMMSGDVESEHHTNCVDCAMELMLEGHNNDSVDTCEILDREYGIYLDGLTEH